jgi:hypothetical protein
MVPVDEETISSRSSRVGTEADLESCGTSLAKAATSSSETVVAWVTAMFG